MKFLKSLFNFYINASIHVALAVYALVRITERYFGLPYNEPLDYVIFYGTISGYNYIKYAGIAKLHHRSLTPALRWIQVFSACCFLAMLHYASFLEVTTMCYMAPFLGLTLLYEIPFLRKKKINLRSIPMVKIGLIAVVWSGVTTVVPLLSAASVAPVAIAVLFVQRLLFVLVLTLPFDIRDVQFDAVSLQTLPQYAGLVHVKKIGAVLLFLTLVLEFYIAPSSVFRQVYFGIFFLLLLFLMYSKESQTKYYASFWVESVPIFWWFALIGFLNAAPSF